MLSKINAEKIPCVIDNKTYYLSRLTDKVKSNYARALLENTLSQMSANKELYKEDYYEVLTRVNTQFATGQFDFGGKLFAESLQSVTGITTMLHLLMQQHHPELTKHDVEELILNNSKELTVALKAAMGMFDDEQPTCKKKDKKNKHKHILTSNDQCIVRSDNNLST